MAHCQVFGSIDACILMTPQVRIPMHEFIPAVAEHRKAFPQYFKICEDNSNFKVSLVLLEMAAPSVEIELVHTLWVLRHCALRDAFNESAGYSS